MKGELNMEPWVDIRFRCVPLRAITRWTPAVDATDEAVALFRRLREAVQKHGQHNSYYLHDGQCVFHLTNHEQIGLLEFQFEGTVLTDADDVKTLHSDLQVELVGEVCPWLVAPVSQWFAETVREAVKVEFDRFIQAGDLEKTRQRLEICQTLCDAQGGYLGIGL
jgi:hypothetical protein